MSAKSSRSNGANGRSLAPFDRGSVDLLRQFPPLSNKSNVSLQLLFFALLEVLSLHLTDNDPTKSRFLFQLQLHFFQLSQILPTTMSLTAGSIRKLDLFHTYVRILRESIQTALSVVQRPSSKETTITSLLEKEFETMRMPNNNNTSQINIDLPLKVPVLLTTNGTIMISDFDNIVVYRYVQDFYELGKLGKGAFGSVFRAKNRLDDRLYAMKKIVFNENTDRTRYQAKCALREVRVLASLTHPNIVQYHCAWLELVPVQSRTASPVKKTLPEIKALDSLDEIIQFEGTEKSSTAPDDEEEEASEASSSGRLSNLEHYHSDAAKLASSSKVPFQRSMSSLGGESEERSLSKQLVPLHCRNQNIHPIARGNFIDAKIVLFIQMQLCDTTLHDWLRHRDQIIVDECNTIEPRPITHRLKELGQRQCWKIFQQLLSAVEYLHSRSFVHRDIKPRNIFLAYDTTDSSSVHVKLGDFGLATFSDSEASPEPADPWRNEESTFVGTALYAPPEQLNTRRCVVTDKSDIYSLGIVLFESFNIFPTDMERLNCLSELRVRGHVEQCFADLYPFESRLIEQSVSTQPADRPSVTQMLTALTNEQKKYSKGTALVTKQMIIEQLQATLRDREERIHQLELKLKERIVN